MREERVLGTQRIYQGRAVGLRVDTVEKPSGRKTTREIVEHADCVAVVALDDNGDVLLVRQFRGAVGEELLEVPAGGIEPGESPEQAVCRELQEETGYRPGRVERMGGFYAAPGYCTEYLHLYLACDLVPGSLQAEDTGEIEVVRVPLGEIFTLITSGSFRDAKSIAGLLMFIGRGRG